MKNKFLPWLIAAGFASLFAASLFYKTAPAPQVANKIPQKTEESQTVQETAEEKSKETVLVTRVVDGDTIEIQGGARVRYIGIDTPETGQCNGEEAAKENAQLVENKKVILETDIQKLDRYGRTLAYVFTDGVFVNEELLKRGLATVTTYPPNVKYVDRFLKAQEEAKNKNAGLWNQTPCSGSKGNAFQGYPPDGSGGQTESAQGGCEIKGNISSSGEKIYHITGQRYYERTKIEENKGERWFCTEEEAQKAGWRKSKV